MCRRFFQKTNKWICFLLFMVKKIIHSFFGRIYSAQICLRFYLTFKKFTWNLTQNIDHLMQVKTLSTFCFNMCVLPLDQIINNALICIGPKFLLTCWKEKKTSKALEITNLCFFTMKDWKFAWNRRRLYSSSLIIL